MGMVEVMFQKALRDELYGPYRIGLYARKFFMAEFWYTFRNKDMIWIKLIRF